MTLDWSLYLQTRMISATIMLQMLPQLRGVSDLTTSLRLFTERKEAHWERADIPRAMDRKQLAGLRNGTINRLPEKIHVRVGLNTEGARLIDCDIIPQEKWGKPHCTNSVNLDCQAL